MKLIGFQAASRTRQFSFMDAFCSYIFHITCGIHSFIQVWSGNIDFRWLPYLATYLIRLVCSVIANYFVTSTPISPWDVLESTALFASISFNCSRSGFIDIFSITAFNFFERLELSIILIKIMESGFTCQAKQSLRLTWNTLYSNLQINASMLITQTGTLC